MSRASVSASTDSLGLLAKFDEKVSNWAASTDPSVDSKQRRGLWREFCDLQEELKGQSEQVHSSSSHWVVC